MKAGMYVGLFGKNKKNEVTWEDTQSAMRAPLTDAEKQLLEKLHKHFTEGIDGIIEDLEDDPSDEDRIQWDEGYIAGISSTAHTIELLMRGEIELR
jgi:hypothetical protein